MGYTNYWQQTKDFTDKEWKNIQAQVKYIDTTGMIRIIQNDENTIMFEGNPDSCERFWLEKKLSGYFKDPDMGKWYKEQFDENGYHHGFCKTRMLPYDLAVWYLLVTINHFTDVLEISRDYEYGDDCAHMAKVNKKCQAKAVM